MKLSDSIAVLPQTKQDTIKKLQSLGIATIKDLLLYLPARYEDYTHMPGDFAPQPGETVTLEGEVMEFKQQYIRRNFSLQTVTLSYRHGTIEVVWYNHVFLKKQLFAGVNVAVAGRIKQTGKKIQLMGESWEILRPDRPKIHTGRWVPIYKESKGITSRTIREKIYSVLAQAEGALEEVFFLPARYAPLPSGGLKEYFFAIHFPTRLEEAHTNRERIALEEVFIGQLASYTIRKKWQEQKTSAPVRVAVFKEKLQQAINLLPFSLTLSQQKVLEEILADVQKPYAMNRFLQGDVGSGKTVLAALAGYLIVLNGYHVLIMAPTDILAQQHYATFQRVLAPLGIAVHLHTSAKKTFTEQGSPSIIIGTHALIHSLSLTLPVGLVVIDEQHRFGVAQRARLKELGGNPHLLTMTATPIPRTVLLTLHGELDVSILTDMPHGRLPVKTYLVPKAKRKDSYAWIENQVKTTGTQVYWVCPLIEESTHETLKDVKAAQKEYEYLSKEVFPYLRLALLHGRMKPKEKDAVMERFKNHELDILVTTSVVEVGVDVANANIMVIEGCERYGLSQLHQLRGRVGRSSMQAYCFLFSESESAYDNERLRFFTKTNSGLELAEYDFQHRGPGDMYGTAQSGHTHAQFSSLLDMHLIEKARGILEAILKQEPEFLRSKAVAARLLAFETMVSRD